MNSLIKELQNARDVVKESGKIARTYYKNSYEVKEKSPDNPVTTADLEINSLIEREIKNLFPDDGWLSEETKDSPERLEKERCWILDPIDGTKEFIKGIPEFVISLALSVKGKAVLGILYNPVTEELFYGAEGQGIFDLDGRPLSVSPYQKKDKISVVASRTELSKNLFSHLNDYYDINPCGSVAYKLGLISSAKYDMNISLVPKNEWDVAAGIALIELAGGVVKNLKRENYSFNNKDTLNLGIVAGHKNFVDDYFNNKPQRQGEPDYHKR